MGPCGLLKAWTLIVEMLKVYGAHVVESSEAQRILHDLFFISGEIPRVTEIP